MGQGKIYLTILKRVLLYKYLLFVIFLIIILISFNRVNTIHKSVYNGNETEFNLKVLSIKHKDNINTVTLIGYEKIISDIDDFPYNVGDIVKIKGKLIKPDNNTIPNTFNYYKYLQSRKINWKLKINNIELVKENSSIVYSIQNQIGKRIRKIPHYEYFYTYDNSMKAIGCIVTATKLIGLNLKEKFAQNERNIYNQWILFLLNQDNFDKQKIETLVNKMYLAFNHYQKEKSINKNLNRFMKISFLNNDK